MADGWRGFLQHISDIVRNVRANKLESPPEREGKQTGNSTGASEGVAVNQEQTTPQEPNHESVTIPFRALGIEYLVRFPSGAEDIAGSMIVSDPNCHKDHVPMQADKLYEVPGFDRRSGNFRVWICKVCNHWITSEVGESYGARAKTEFLRGRKQ